MSIVEKLINDREAFEDWLSQKDTNQVVGVTFFPDACPVSTFITESLGVRCSVTPEYTRDVDGHELSNPVWLRRFVKVIDCTDDDSVPITAARALRVLNIVNDLG